MENDSDNKEILVDQAWRAGEESKRFYEMTYAGATSFLRRKYTKELKAIEKFESLAVTYYDLLACFENREAYQVRYISTAEIENAYDICI